MPETACAARGGEIGQNCDEAMSESAKADTSPPAPLPPVPRDQGVMLSEWARWDFECAVMACDGMSPEFAPMAASTGTRLSDPEQKTARIRAAERGYPRRVERALRPYPEARPVLLARYHAGERRSVRFVAQRLRIDKSAAQVRIAWAEGVAVAALR